MFFENHVQVFEARTEERVQSNLKKANQLRSKFFEITKVPWLQGSGEKFRAPQQGVACVQCSHVHKPTRPGSELLALQLRRS